MEREGVLKLKWELFCTEKKAKFLTFVSMKRRKRAMP